MSHPRSKQGFHGVKGGKAGNREEALSGGKLGARFGKLGGQKSKGKQKKVLTILQSLRVYSVFIAYDLLDGAASIFGNYPSEARIIIKEYCWGMFHKEPKARMREGFIWLAEQDAAQKYRYEKVLKKNPSALVPSKEQDIQQQIAEVMGTKKSRHQLID